MVKKAPGASLCASGLLKLSEMKYIDDRLLAALDEILDHARVGQCRYIA
jgi:hypothetical protein